MDRRAKKGTPSPPRGSELSSEVAESERGNGSMNGTESPPRETASNPPRRPLSAEAFQETLTRYCRRTQKDGREFCVASLTVLEYKKASGLEKEHLDKAVVNVLMKFLRSEDRICFIEPAHYLILTPYTSLADATTALNRVAEKISHSRIRVKTKFIHPSASVKVVSSAEYAQERGDAAIDSESIYKSVGYVLDSKGRPHHIDQPDHGHSEPLFNGNYEGWVERYQFQNGKGKFVASSPFDDVAAFPDSSIILARDKWDKGTPVEMRKISIVFNEEKNGRSDTATSGGAPFDGSLLVRRSGSLLRRLRALQNLDRSGFNVISDFFAGRDGSLLLVHHPARGTELTELVSSNKKLPVKLTTDVLISWTIQILTSLVTLQALAPPLVPGTMSKLKVYYEEDEDEPCGKITLGNFEDDYLAADDEVKSSNLLPELIEFILQLDACGGKKTDKSFISFLKRLDGNALSSPYKLRTQIKNFAESLHA